MSSEMHPAVPLPDVPHSGITVTHLISREGFKAFNQALVAANGIAAVIVHPFYPDLKIHSGHYNDETIAHYEQYQIRLAQAVQRYQELGLPIVLFEEESNIPTVSEIIKRMGLSQGTVFVVPTIKGDPHPIGADFSRLVKKMHALGLKKVTVSGTNFWYYEQDPPVRRTDVTYASEKYILTGCVGITMKYFIAEDIPTIIGFATHPRQQMKRTFTPEIAKLFDPV